MRPAAAASGGDSSTLPPDSDSLGKNQNTGTPPPPPGGPDDKEKKTEVNKTDKTSSKYENITKGRSVQNRGTDVSREEFEQNLRDAGWNESKSADGKTTIFEKDGARYAVRDNAKSTGGSAADYYKPGSSSIDVKIRLGGQ